MRTMFRAVIASTTLMTSTACKKTETEATGTQQTELDKANAALVDELGKRADVTRSHTTETRTQRKYTVYGSSHVTGIAAC